MSRKLTSSEFQAKHAKRLKASTEEIKAGVGAVTDAPSALAIAKKDKMRTNLLASIDDGTWEKRLGEVTLTDWKRDMIEKGIGRISKGIDEAAPKVRKFADVLLPHAYAISDTVKGMADLTLEDSVARAEYTIRQMAELKFKKA